MIILNRERGIFLNGNFSTIPETYSHIFVYKEINKISKKKMATGSKSLLPLDGKAISSKHFNVHIFRRPGQQSMERQWAHQKNWWPQVRKSVEFDGIDGIDPRMLHVHYNTIVMIHTYILHRCIFWVYVFDIYIYALYIWVCAYINIIHCTLFYT